MPDQRQLKKRRRSSVRVHNRGVSLTFSQNGFKTHGRNVGGRQFLKYFTNLICNTLHVRLRPQAVESSRCIWERFTDGSDAHSAIAYISCMVELRKYSTVVFS